MLRRRRAQFIGPGEAAERLVEAWKQDPAKVEWCSEKRPDLSVDLMLRSHAERVWFSLDPLSQLADVPFSRMRRAQEQIIKTMSGQQFPLWKADAEAAYAGERFPLQPYEQWIRAVAARDEWIRGGRQ